MKHRRGAATGRIAALTDGDIDIVGCGCRRHDGYQMAGMADDGRLSCKFGYGGAEAGTPPQTA